MSHMHIYIGICRSKFYALQEMAMFRYRNYCKNFPHTCQTKTKTSVYRNRWTSVNIYILYFQRHMYVHMFHIGIVKRILCPRVIVALRRL